MPLLPPPPQAASKQLDMASAKMVGNVLRVMTALPAWMEKCAPGWGGRRASHGVTHTFGFCEPEFLLDC